MLLIRGEAGGTALTGTLYEPGDDPPSFSGAPDDGAPYVWVCDSFYEVASGGQVQRIGDREVNVAFESPSPRGFETREQAIEAAKDHVRTQFQRIGLDSEDVTVAVEQP
ncbi:DUF7113 family protein [Halapricum desulfuricans]|nr:hypothetical protein [Halapricum desulfuricans]